MISDESFEPTVHKRETIYEGHVWNVRSDLVELNDFHMTRDYVVHMGAVGVVAINEHAELLLIKQYRHPIGQMMWEVPAGLLDATNEDPLEAAKRELLEETGYTASTWNVLLDFASSSGGSTEAVRVYLAQGLTEHPEGKPNGEDEESLIEPQWIGVQDVLDGIWSGAIGNTMLTAGTLALVTALADPSALRPANAHWALREHLVKTNRVRLPQ